MNDIIGSQNTSEGGLTMFLKFTTKIIEKGSDRLVKMILQRDRIISISSITLDSGAEVAEIVYLDGEGLGKHVITEESFNEVSAKI